MDVADFGFIVLVAGHRSVARRHSRRAKGGECWFGNNSRVFTSNCVRCVCVFTDDCVKRISYNGASSWSQWLYIVGYQCGSVIVGRVNWSGSSLIRLAGNVDLWF